MYKRQVANRAVSLSVKPGEAHAVLGENGAGKSTLMKIIYGAVKPDEGDIQYNGQAVQIRNPQQARALGISMVFQHFSLFDTLSVAENVWLGLDPSLTLAQALQGQENVWALAADTDGIDGIEDNAGALVTPDTLARGAHAGLSLDEHLACNDAYGYFQALNDLVFTGPTHTNVNDFRAILVL